MKTLQKMILGLLVILLTLTSAGCTAASKAKTPLIIFAAGSLIKPFADLEKAFETQYPNIDVQAEYHGSIQVIRHATDLHESIDVIATADRSLIPMLMYQVNVPDTGQPYANSYLSFATNKLGLAYTDKSRYASEITPENWLDILTRPDVKVGIADPRFDASGYRALMVFKLAEPYFHQSDAFMRMFAGQFRYPIKVDETNGNALIRVPEVLETKPDSHIVIRGASVQLLALLESGDLDYAFEYNSVIQQHQLKLVELSPELNLGDPAQNDGYGKVTVKLDFQRFATVKPEFKGEQIGYGIVIPTNAPHPKEAAQFIAFLLSPEGRKIMEDDHHPIFDTVLADGYDNLPDSLKKLSSPAP